MSYTAPLAHMRFVLNELADLNGLCAYPAYADCSVELADSVLEEAARLAAEAFAPANAVGDREGARVVDGQVQVPAAFVDAYRRFVDGGWPLLPCPPEYGGQGLPQALALCVTEMWKGANLALSLCPMLTHGAVEALHRHGDEALRARYLPALVSGRWTATMSMTEPQAGSDLGAITTRAWPDGDHYRLRGRKIFITWGDHPLAENIVHLVLARLPDAPPGVKGLSLFLVPRRLPQGDGTPGEPNDLRALSVEHKLGIHGSPTCAMAFGEGDGAHAWLVGEAHRGIECMFTMMNHARLTVGVEGLALAEAARQRALAWARERVQGRLPDGTGPVSIVHHPDVRRMLLTMKAGTEAMRSLVAHTAAAMDRARHEPDAQRRAAAAARMELLTPVVKGWCTYLGEELVSLALQVHGGSGYVEETGIAQLLRDVRITSIYEGTNGIQANDLAGRKVLRDDGAAMGALLQDVRATVASLEQAGDDAMLAAIAGPLAAGADRLERAVGWLLGHAAADAHATGSVAHHLLMLTGTVAGGWQLARGALAATRRGAAGEGGREFSDGRRVVARFYAEQLMPRTAAQLAALETGSGTLMALAEDCL